MTTQKLVWRTGASFSRFSGELDTADKGHALAPFPVVRVWRSSLASPLPSLAWKMRKNNACRLQKMSPKKFYCMICYSHVCLWVLTPNSRYLEGDICQFQELISKNMQITLFTAGCLVTLFLWYGPTIREYGAVVISFPEPFSGVNCCHLRYL